MFRNVVRGLVMMLDGRAGDLAVVVGKAFVIVKWMTNH
jgi:hypothetical protein